MNIIIIGAGGAGFSLAEYFSRLNHHITVIERDRSLCEDINNKLDVFTINSPGSSPQALEEAGLKTADMLIAVTSSDEVNLLACSFACQNKVKQRIARIKSSIYSRKNSCVDLQKLGITHLIEPEREVVKKIIQYIELPGITETANFQSDSIYLRACEITENTPIANKTIAEISKMAKPYPILFVAVIRNNKSVHPAGNQKIINGDKIAVIMPRGSFPAFRGLINKQSLKLRKIIVSGDSLTAIHLSEALKPFSERVILADPDYKHAKEAASGLEGIEVLHADTTSIDFLREINVNYAGCFIAAGKDTEDNIMSCLLAKTEGAKMVIALRNDNRYNTLFNSLGIDHIINPQEVTLNSIIEKIHRLPLGTHLRMKIADIEILHLRAEKKSKITTKPLQSQKELSGNSIIIGAVINRSNSVVIPQGSTVVNPEDEAIVLCPKKHAKLARALFKYSII